MRASYALRLYAFSGTAPGEDGRFAAVGAPVCWSSGFSLFGPGSDHSAG